MIFHYDILVYLFHSEYKTTQSRSLKSETCSKTVPPRNCLIRLDIFPQSHDFFVFLVCNLKLCLLQIWFKQCKEYYNLLSTWCIKTTSSVFNIQTAVLINFYCWMNVSMIEWDMLYIPIKKHWWNIKLLLTPLFTQISSDFVFFPIHIYFRITK